MERFCACSAAFRYDSESTLLVYYLAEAYTSRCSCSSTGLGWSKWKMFEVIIGFVCIRWMWIYPVSRDADISLTCPVTHRMQQSTAALIAEHVQAEVKMYFWTVSVTTDENHSAPL